MNDQQSASQNNANESAKDIHAGKQTNNTKAPKTSMIIFAKTGIAFPTSPGLANLPTVQTKIPPGGYSWAVFAKKRGVQQKIRTGL